MKITTKSARSTCTNKKVELHNSNSLWSNKPGDCGRAETVANLAMISPLMLSQIAVTSLQSNLMVVDNQRMVVK